MELIQELMEIHAELLRFTDLRFDRKECWKLAVQIQRNRILEDSFLSGPSENLSFFSPEAKELLKED